MMTSFMSGGVDFLIVVSFILYTGMQRCYKVVAVYIVVLYYVAHY